MVLLEWYNHLKRIVKDRKYVCSFLNKALPASFVSLEICKGHFKSSKKIEELTTDLVNVLFRLHTEERKSEEQIWQRQEISEAKQVRRESDQVIMITVSCEAWGEDEGRVLLRYFIIIRSIKRPVSGNERDRGYPTTILSKQSSVAGGAGNSILQRLNQFFTTSKFVLTDWGEERCWLLSFTVSVSQFHQLTLKLQWRQN